MLVHATGTVILHTQKSTRADFTVSEDLASSLANVVLRTYHSPQLMIRIISYKNGLGVNVTKRHSLAVRLLLLVY
jgi:hypothetical protein